MERPRIRPAIPPGPVIRGRPAARTTTAVAAERLALERERARLERELAVWRRNQARAEARLREVTQRLAALEAPGADAAPGAAVARPRPDAPSGPWHSIVVEY
ncbi:MAG: hypothetical protein RMK84_01095 [Oscillochloridaceae bacterium]|nr:hypothetical protein [Chloroflexaceae bacterium]MDW8388694.1 hypothetical protein [Oscillochloridaceae bacterium]